MRNALTATLALLLAAAACARNSPKGTAGSASGGMTAGGTTTGGAAGLAPGAPCSDDQACASGICGIGGTGNCCAKACSTGSSACGASGCDDTGACAYPPAGTACGDLCAPGSCDGTGSCDAGTPQMCAGNYACSPDGGCLVRCTSSGDCAPGFVCNAQACVTLQATGPCTENDDCANGICGIHGTGQCCNTGCVTGAPCGAEDCDDAGACSYPGSETACGSVSQSCSSHTQQNPTACDGTGACGPKPGAIDCAPFVCGPTACLTNCTSQADCVGGDFCDTASAVCCAGLFANGIIRVDAVTGDDSLPCCGLSFNRPCETLAQAMKSIDAAGVMNVTIIPTVESDGGTWNSNREVYPIKLGWGVELNAPGIFFWDPGGQNAEIFDVAAYSTTDPAGYASICGSATNSVSIGMNGLGGQSTDLSAIQIEAGNTLYLSTASVNGSADGHTAAITVSAGASLVLGDDQANLFPGTVFIGNALNSPATDGFDGIVCESANGKGCTVSDSALEGISSVVIQGQEDSDIIARDFASISLTSAPVIGIPPADAGFGECSAKPDVDGMGLGSGQAVLLDGLASVTFGNGTLQCLSGTAFLLEASIKGTPTLTLENTTIQNTERAIYATAGSATVSGSTIQFNYNGVEQSSDQTHVASIDLSGGADGGMNTVVCSSKKESVDALATSPGVCVLNDSTGPLDASNVKWDTSAPDLFLCAGLSSCTCQSSGCTDTPGQDGMDAVYESSGTIATTGNGLSTVDCGAP